MEGLSSSVYKSLKGYWRRRGYEKLNGTGRRRESRVDLAATAAAGDGSNRRKRFWRIKLRPRLKLKLRLSPKKFLIGLRDAYVNFMNRIASTRVIISSGVGADGYGGDTVSGFGVRPLKEYDVNMIIELYKSLVMAQGQLVPRKIVKIGT